VIVPCLADPVLAATEYVTVPLPVPLVPNVIVIHWLLLAAVHAQPELVVTLMEPVAAPPGMVRFVGVIA